MQAKTLIGGEFAARAAGDGDPGPGVRREDDAHGDMKQSGYGKDMSIWGLEDYTVVRDVMGAHRGDRRAVADHRA